MSACDDNGLAGDQPLPDEPTRPDIAQADFDGGDEEVFPEDG